MLLRRAPGFVAALILLPLSILAPAIPGYTAMICRMTGAAIASDCVEAAETDQAPAPASQDGWTAASCCDVLRVTFSRAPAESQAEALAQPASLERAVGSPTLPVLAPRGLERPSTAPAGLGPPRRFVTQTFLI